MSLKGIIHILPGIHPGNSNFFRKRDRMSCEFEGIFRRAFEKSETTFVKQNRRLNVTFESQKVVEMAASSTRFTSHSKFVEQNGLYFAFLKKKMFKRKSPKRLQKRKIQDFERNVFWNGCRLSDIDKTCFSDLIGFFGFPIGRKIEADLSWDRDTSNPTAKHPGYFAR